MAIGIVIFLLSLITIVRFRRCHAITQPLLWWGGIRPREGAFESAFFNFRGSSVSFAKFAAMRRAWSRVRPMLLRRLGFSPPN
jgi:hypothetical protein